MAEYEMIVRLPESRTGKTPDCGGWTFHHVLPWKYFYCLSAILSFYYYSAAKSYRGDGELDAKLAFFNGIVSCDKDIAHGANCTIFKFREIAHLIDSLKRTNNSIVGRIDDWVNSADRMRQLLVECTSPNFGGFPGMDGKQRSDDPESNMEKTRPYNGPIEWWAALMAIGNTLEHISSFPPAKLGNCKQLKHSAYGDSVKFKLSDNHIENLLAQVRVLSSPAFNNSVLPFDEKSWQLNYQGNMWSFVIANNIFQHAAYNPDKSLFAFKVTSDNSHFNRSKHIEMTRCPGIDNEKNVLRPTTEGAKAMGKK